MVQVYFDKELVRMFHRSSIPLPDFFGSQAPHIDRSDFLNGVVREKKRKMPSTTPSWLV
jgi:hypothetical protein